MTTVFATTLAPALIFVCVVFQSDDFLIYPADTEHEQNFAYLIVDPLKRHVIVFSHSYGTGVFE